MRAERVYGRLGSPGAGGARVGDPPGIELFRWSLGLALATPGRRRVGRYRTFVFDANGAQPYRSFF